MSLLFSAGVFCLSKMSNFTPSNRARPSCVPIQMYPSPVWAMACTVFCGRPFSESQTCRPNSRRPRFGSRAMTATPLISMSDAQKTKRAMTCAYLNIRRESCNDTSRRGFFRAMQLRRLNFAFLWVTTLSLVAVYAGDNRWRSATEAELKRVIPARAPVIKENIETEFRTASGVTDGQGKFIAGVVMITAGYSAEGKYSHFFIAQVPMQIGEFSLTAGEYVIGYQRKTPDSITVTFYRASSGDTVGEVEAFRNRKSSMVRALLIQPATGGKGTIQVGRFVFDYHVD